MKKSILTAIGIVSLSCAVATFGDVTNDNVMARNKVKIYPVKVTSIKTNSDGEFVIKGTTKAPKGTKVFIQDKKSDVMDPTQNQFSSMKDASWVKVKNNGKFKGYAEASDVIEGHESKNWDVYAGDKGKIKIFAATNIPKKTDDTDIPKSVRTALKKSNIKYTTVTADEKVADKGDSSSSSSASSSSASVDTSESYQPISYDDLARHPMKNLNKPIQISGEVLQVEHDDGDLLILMFMDDDPDETVMVNVNKKDKPSGSILKHDKITIQGNAGGKQSYETVLGENRDIPYVDCNEKVIDNGQ